MSDDGVPVLVGAGQVGSARWSADVARSPVELATAAAERALADTGADDRIRGAIDEVAFVRLFADSAARLESPFGGSSKPPRSVAARLGIRPTLALYSQVGGNVPQQLVNQLARAAARGEIRAALIVGAEALRTTAEALRAGLALDWNEDPPGEMLDEGRGEPLASRHELAHGIGIPVQTYPLFEHAMRGRRGATVAEHLAMLGQLMAPFTRVAARNPYAAFPIERTPEELVRVTAENRWIGHPYPKLLNAQDKVDQAAAVIVTTLATARALGIDPARCVQLLGHADVHEKLHMLDRVDYTGAPAVRAGARLALSMAGLEIRDIDCIDLYSCFPSAVEAGCDALGLAYDDPRGLTLTGGLPFFGGPGNNYSLHAICEAVDRVRREPGARALIWANGGYLSKHAFGIYGAYDARQAPLGEDGSAQAQRAIDAAPGPAVVEAPQGAARVETYTVIHERGVPRLGIVIGRLTENGARFVANVPAGRPDVLDWMLTREPLGAPGRVASRDGRNFFLPEM